MDGAIENFIFAYLRVKYNKNSIHYELSFLLFNTTYAIKIKKIVFNMIMPQMILVSPIKTNN